MTTTPLSDEAKALVEAHLPLVRHVLAGVAAHYPRHADREELAQAAALGLVEAAARYDEARGVPFDRWAALRIRGAIVDAVRALDFAPRTLRSAAREAEAARVTLEGSLGRTPTIEETAEQMGVPASTLANLQGRVHRSLVLSLDAPCGEEDGDPLTLGTGLVDMVQLQPVEVLEQRERATYLRDALACLPERLKDVVVGYFLDGETSADLATRLGVTESRVSQMRTEALKLMRAGIEAQYQEKPAAQPDDPGRTAYRQAAYAAQLASRSTYATRLSRLPQARSVADPLEVRAAG
ncbi:MAG: FliA/WhiG subfamily polymerase sigma-28 subunit [Frankiales bacterium]|nr:FliA/WhiG subfamily polymerase sigma-28 subunit [Frankiales bacterium]